MHGAGLAQVEESSFVYFVYFSRSFIVEQNRRAARLLISASLGEEAA
jgi:hypothetical protein